LNLGGDDVFALHRRRYCFNHNFGCLVSSLDSTAASDVDYYVVHDSSLLLCSSYLYIGRLVFFCVSDSIQFRTNQLA